MIIRETCLGRIVFAAIAAWSSWFAFDVARIGDKVTSKQWQYLMEVPGGKWLWMVLFLTPGVVTLLAVAFRRYRVVAVGLFGTGAACLIITGFYWLAPLIDPGLLTLGYNAWMFPAGAAFLCAALNWTDAVWF